MTNGKQPAALTKICIFITWNHVWFCERTRKATPTLQFAQRSCDTCKVCLAWAPLFKPVCVREWWWRVVNGAEHVPIRDVAVGCWWWCWWWSVMVGRGQSIPLRWSKFGTFIITSWKNPETADDVWFWWSMLVVRATICNHWHAFFRSLATIFKHLSIIFCTWSWKSTTSKLFVSWTAMLVADHHWTCLVHCCQQWPTTIEERTTRMTYIGPLKHRLKWVGIDCSCEWLTATG